MEFVVNDLRYTTLTETTVSVRQNSLSLSGALTIPATVTYDNVTYNVTEVAEQGFNGYQGITSLTISSGVTKIGSMAFSGSSLTSVSIPSNITIESWAFANCISLTSLYIPDRVLYIGENAFRGCSSLATLRLGEYVEYADFVFYDCDALTSVTIPAHTNIPEVSGVFGDCSSIRSVTISEGLQYIGNAFENSENIESLTIPSTFTSFDYEVPGTAGYARFDRTKITKMVMPSSNPPKITWVTFATTVEFEVPVGSVSTYKSADVWSSRHANYIYSKPSIKYYSDGSLYNEIVYKSGDAVTAPPDPEAPIHYHFSAWSPALPATMPDQNITTYAQFQINSWNITYMSDNQVFVTQTYDYGDVITPPYPSPQKEHYEFNGWNPALPATMPDNPLTVWAQFLGNQHTITYMVLGSVYRVVTLRYLDEVPIIDCPDVPHKKNQGWDKNLPPWMTDEDIVVNGVYVDYSVTFMAEGSVVSSRTYAYGETIVVPSAPAKEHYTFDYWDPTPAQTMTDGDKVYNAVYIGDPQTITYRVDGQVWQVQNVRYGDTINAPQGPEKTHYNFVSWTPALPETVTGNLVVDAVYEPITYYISYMYDGQQMTKVGYPYNTTVTPPISVLEELNLGYYVSGFDPTLPALMPGYDFEVEVIYDLKTYYITFVVDNQTYKTLGYLYSQPIQVPVVPPKSGYYGFWDYVPSTMPYNDITVTAVYIAEGDAEIITDWPIFREKLVRDTDGDIRQGNIIGDTFTRPATIASYDVSTGDAYYLDNVAVLLTDSTDTITTNYFYKRYNGTEDATVDVELPVKTSEGRLYKADWLQSRTQNGVIFFLGSEFADAETNYYLQLEDYLEQVNDEFYQVLTNSVTGTQHRGNLVHVKSEVASWSGQYYQSAYPKWQRDITSADDERTYKYYIPESLLTRRDVIVRPAGNAPYHPDFSYGDEPWPYVMYPQGVRLYRDYDSDMFEALFEWYDEDDYPIQAMSKEGDAFVIMTAGATSAGDNYTTLWMMSEGVIYDVIRRAPGTSITAWPSYTIDGYTFSGVSTSNGGSAITLPYTVPGSNTNLYIIWTAIPVPPTPQPTPIWTLTYKVMGSVYATVKVPDNELVAAYRPAAPSVSGYNFTGWSNEPQTATADATINANFTQVATGSHTLTYKIGSTVISTMSVKTGDVIPVAPYPTRAGYTFNGWSGFPADMIMPANALTITGSWTAKPDPLAS